MYHPSRGGVRGGRDQFKWDDVKVDKHRENYLGHSIKAPVGRWQKGKDLFWYTRDKNQGLDQDGLKAEIQKVKEEEEQLMREALGLAPKRSNQPQGNRLDKHEFSELVKRGSTAEDLGGGHAEAAHVHGLGFSRGPRSWETSTSVEPSARNVSAEPAAEVATESATKRMHKEEDSDEEEGRRKKRKHDERKREERKRDKHEIKERRHCRDSDDKRNRRKDKERRRDRD